MPEPCIRCGSRPATIDWLHCEPCWQEECDEVQQARAELDASTAPGADDDAAHP